MFDERVHDALWVIEVANGRKKASTPEEWLRALIYATKILRLYDIGDKLNGWSRYVYDKSNTILGENAKIKLRELRRNALNKIISFSEPEIKAIKNSLKEEFISSRVLDYEPALRPNFYKLLNIFLSDTSIRYYKLSLMNPFPLNVLVNDVGYMLVLMDEFYLPIETINEFEQERDAYAFFSNFLMLILYAKQKKLFEANALISDKFASKYLKESYRIFSKSIKDGKKLSIAELIKEGSIWDAVAELQMHENFYNAFKHMYNVSLVSFGYGELKINSFVADVNLSVDKYGLEKMAEAFEENKNATKEYFMSICYLNNLIQDYLVDKRTYLSRELEPVIPENIGFALPLKINAECTADCKKIVPLNNIPCSIFGIKNIYIETADNKFILIKKAPEDFEIDPVNGTIAKTEIYSSPENPEFLKGGVFFIPEFLGLLSNIMIVGKIDEEVVIRLNSNPTYRRFNFVSEKEKRGISGYFTDIIKATEKRSEK